MIKSISIENYKSINKLKLGLGRVTVLIGENGCGKSNILEAFALASAAAVSKLDNEFLLSRGVRVTEAAYMRSAFNKEDIDKPISINIEGTDGKAYHCKLKNDNTPYSKWKNESGIPVDDSTIKTIQKLASSEVNKKEFENELAKIFKELFKSYTQGLCIDEYLIYSPENSALRSFEKESYIQPLGSNGEGLYKLLGVMQASEKAAFNELKNHLRLMGWFKDFRIPTDTAFSENKLEIQDRFIDETLSYFDQKSANEGFLLLLFYLAVFLSEKSPKFFAIDNIDTSLNPRLCQRLIKDLSSLAKKYGKQVIFTTHNPAILDGMNLNDEDQQLWVVSRDRSGKTKVNRVSKPILQEGQSPVKLSEAFLRGAIGGLPKRF